MDVTIYQGEAREIGIKAIKDGIAVTDENASVIEAQFASVDRKNTDEENPLAYDAEHSEWVLFLTQDETMRIPPSVYPLFVRAKLTDGNSVPAVLAGEIEVLRTEFKEVLV